MRENIGLYRGKRIDNDEWTEGSLLKMQNVGYTAWAIISGEGKHGDMVKPETVGECVGLLDENGKLIFEGDILRYEYGGVCSVEYGRFNCGCCHGVFGWSITQDGDIRDYKYHKVIGNIHDNPELLEAADG